MPFLMLDPSQLSQPNTVFIFIELLYFDLVSKTVFPSSLLLKRSVILEILRLGGPFMGVPTIRSLED